MVDIRPNVLPSAILPLRRGDALIVDQGADGVRQTDPFSMTDSVAPVASQAEAVAGLDNTKRMTPLRTKQSIASEIGVTLASNTQGVKADSAVQSVNGKSGNSVTLVKGDVGLGNVDNTSDLDKPISTATQAALNLKANDSVVVKSVNGIMPTSGNVTISAEEVRLQDTRASAITQSFASNVQFVETAGYSSVGDGGGALYKRVSTEPSHAGKFQSADGAWWELSYTGAVNVLCFGASQTAAPSVNDAAISRAILFLQANSSRGGAVYIPGGWYNISATITVPERIELRGDGRGKTLLRCTSSGSTISPIVHIAGQNASLKGIEVLYSSLQTTAGTGILSTGNQAQLSDFYVYSAYVGLHVHSGSAQFISNFEINDCKQNGIIVGQNTSSFINDVYISNFLCVSNDHTNFNFGTIRLLGRIESLNMYYADLIGSNKPITCDPGSTVGCRFSVFTAVYFDEHELPAEFSGIKHSTFTDCWISGRGVGGKFTDCHSLSIKGLRLYGNNETGLQLDNCHHIQFSDGDFSYNNSDNIADQDDVQVFANCSDITFRGIMGAVAGNTRSAIFINSGAQRITVEGTQFSPRASSVIRGIENANGYRCVGNVNFKTLNRGADSLPAGSTSMAISHGLAIPPLGRDIQIMQNGATQTPLYVQSVSATTFTVSTVTANGSPSPFSWVADSTSRGM